MPTFESPKPITATVEIATGAVHVVASIRQDTVVDVRPRDESRSHDVKAADQVRVDFHHGILTVSSQRGFSFPRRGAVVVDIALPSGSRLSASAASATVLAEGEFGDCTFASASGELTIGSVTGNLRAETASGAVTVDVITGSADISTASGTVRLGESGGHTEFRAASGSVTVGRVRGNLIAHTASGAVTVGIAEGTSAQLDLRTGSGAIRNSLQPSDGPVDGEPTVVVHATTNSGDVTVQRAVTAGSGDPFRIR